MPGAKRLGAVLYELDGTAIEPSIIDVPGLAPYWIDDVIEEVYPRPPADNPGPG
jgi:alkaline phosphatase D